MYVTVDATRIECVGFFFCLFPYSDMSVIFFSQVHTDMTKRTLNRENSICIVFPGEDHLCGLFLHMVLCERCTYPEVLFSSWCPEGQPAAYWSVLHNVAAPWAESSRDTRERREWNRGRRTRGERIATVNANKNHLSHLCNLFSFNMRSMLKRSGSLWEAWEGSALG